jgi:hypothetical protein
MNLGRLDLIIIAAILAIILLWMVLRLIRVD